MAGGRGEEADKGGPNTPLTGNGEGRPDDDGNDGDAARETAVETEGEEGIGAPEEGEACVERPDGSGGVSSATEDKGKGRPSKEEGKPVRPAFPRVDGREGETDKGGPNTPATGSGRGRPDDDGDDGDAAREAAAGTGEEEEYALTR
jgi:hypothetical protein